MLAGDAAAELDAGAQRGGAGFDDAIELAGRAHVEQNVRMQIAIAGVKHVGDAKIKFFADRGDAPHHLRQLAARHDAVLDVIIRRQRAHGAESAFAAFP